MAGEIGTNPVIRLFSAAIVFKIVTIYLMPTVCHALINAVALLCSRCYYPHLTQEKSEAPRSEEMCPKPITTK